MPKTPHIVATGVTLCTTRRSRQPKLARELTLADRPTEIRKQFGNMDPRSLRVISISMHSLDELLAAWRTDPSPDLTGHALSANPRRTAGALRPGDARKGDRARAEAVHSADSAVMLAVGTLCLKNRPLAEAQVLWSQPARANTRDPAVFRWPGEVLLRRGTLCARESLERAGSGPG